MKRLTYIAILLIGITSGCTHRQLRYNTVNSAKTVSDVQTKVVLDNLAKFAANPGALPHFTFPQAGASGVTDQFGASEGQEFSPLRLLTWSFGITAGRSNVENYTLVPINDPRKLELMRCAYQKVVQGHCNCGNSQDCPNCTLRLNRFYLGEEFPSHVQQATYDGKPLSALFPPGFDPDAPEGTFESQRVYEDTDQFGNAVFYFAESGAPVDKATIEAAKKDERLKELSAPNSITKLGEATGRTTTECLNNRWFKVCERSCLDKLDACSLIGEYCGTCVVVPECHRDQLTKLTLVILDIALNDEAEIEAEPAKTKEVVALLNSKGQLATSAATAVLTVKQVVPASTDLQGLFKQESPSDDGPGPDNGDPPADGGDPNTDVETNGGEQNAGESLEGVQKSGVIKARVTNDSRLPSPIATGDIGNSSRRVRIIDQRKSSTQGTELLNRDLQYQTLSPF